MNRLVSLVMVFLLLFVALSAQSRAESSSVNYQLTGVHPQVAELIAAKTEPDGVVFDIETLDPQALNHLTEYVIEQVKLVKKAYPDVDVAIVSHGSEEFALQKTSAKENAELHGLFNQLVETEEVSVHVCGAVAGLKELSQEDFPDFVSYSASGMAQINDYKAIGYSVITIHELTAKQRKALFETPEKFMK